MIAASGFSIDDTAPARVWAEAAFGQTARIAGASLGGHGIVAGLARDDEAPAGLALVAAPGARGHVDIDLIPHTTSLTLLAMLTREAVGEHDISRDSVTLWLDGALVEASAERAPQAGEEMALYAITLAVTPNVVASLRISLAASCDTLILVGPDADAEAPLRPQTAMTRISPMAAEPEQTLDDAMPCFVAGAMVQTAGGEVPVELLVPGDLVRTHEGGFQPLTAVTRQKMTGLGATAPIRVEAGTFGRHGTLLLAPTSQILIRDPLAQMLFGTQDVLAATADLVDGNRVRRVEGNDVTYVTLGFETPQIVFSEGIWSESALPDETARDEGREAHRLAPHEARLLFSGEVAA